MFARVARRAYLRTCARCARRFEALRPGAQWCSPACKQAAYRERCAERAAAAQALEEGAGP